MARNVAASKPSIHGNTSRRPQPRSRSSSTSIFFPAIVSMCPKEETDFLNTKEVGEPPLVLAISVLLAAKSAVRASRIERGLSGLFRFDAPATVERVRCAWRNQGC